MCIKSNLFRLTLLLLIGFCAIKQTHGYCSLEKMKMYAAEACEHLFQQDESRDKRSISNHHHLNRLGFGKIHDKHHYISRSIYPAGGYLKVNFDHFNKLSQIDVVPRYKPKKMHHEKKERYKRSNISYNNIPYCCYNRCEDDFFC